MNGNKLQAALDDFVQIVMGIAEETASDTLTARAESLRTVKHPNRKPMASKTKRKSMIKPCPVLACENIGAPRHGMCCAEHGSLDKAEKAALRFAAKEPGGKWNPGAAVNKATKSTDKVSGKKKPMKAKKPAKAKAKAKTKPKAA